MSGKKNCAAARQAVKNARRLRRKKGGKRWFNGEQRAEAQKLLVMHGNGGTDKSGSRKRSIVYYSAAEARR